MKTITVEVEQVTKQKTNVEIQLPFYSKSGDAHYKIDEEERVVRVWTSNRSASISCHSLSISTKEATQGEIIEQAEFDEAMQAALNIINPKNDKATELLCEEIKHRAVNDGITTPVAEAHEVTIKNKAA